MNTNLKENKHGVVERNVNLLASLNLSMIPPRADIDI